MRIEVRELNRKETPRYKLLGKSFVPTSVAERRITTDMHRRERGPANLSNVDAKTLPAGRPLQGLSQEQILARLRRALNIADGVLGAHCIHELWMRGEMSTNIERALERLWACAATSVPEWLPMRHIDWLPTLYEIALRFHSAAKGKSNIYLVLLDFTDRGDTYGVYVGMSKYTPSQRFDQHKAGIRAAGSVLKRGLEVLTGPAMHLQYIKRTEAERIEVQLAEALGAAGLYVKGGH
jgi:hypothetical protein